MDRSKLVAVVTGAISILLAILYLLVVQLLDFRGEMKPAPIDDLLIIPHATVNLSMNRTMNQAVTGAIQQSESQPVRSHLAETL